MLERATACLKAGARDSLRCANHNSTRSRRMLHSAFWTHGASDIDLPPFALPLHPLSNGDSAVLQRQRRHVSAPTEEPFLDFLYPPQALAWLRRANGRNCERRERRNARRLPDGFVQVSRSYSSKSDPRYGSAASYVPMGAGTGSQGLQEMEDQESGGQTGVESNTVVADGLPDIEKLASEEARSEEDHEPGYTYPLLDFSEEDLSQPGEVLRRLRNVLNIPKRHQNQHTAKAAWSLYRTLEADDQNNSVLKKALLLWLHSHDTPLAFAHCISLYWSFLPQERTLEIYQAALDAFVSRQDWESASGLHREALDTIANGPQITKSLFASALVKQDWLLALQTQTEHHDHFSGPGQASQVAVFWFNVSENEQLLTTADRLFTQARIWQQNSEHTDVLHDLMQLATRMTEEAFLQLARVPLENVSSDHGPAHAVGRLANKVLVPRSTKPKEILETVIMSILQKNDTAEKYLAAHLPLSSMYMAYQHLSDAKLPEAILLLLLQRMVHWDPRQSRPQKGGLHLSTIVKHWKEAYGKLSVPALLVLLRFYASQGDVANVKLYSDYAIQQHPSFEDRKGLLWPLVYVHARRADLARALKTFADVQDTAKAHDHQLDIKTWGCLIYAHAQTDDLDGALETYRKFMATGMAPTHQIAIPVALMLARRGEYEAVEKFTEEYYRFRRRPRLDADFTIVKLKALVTAYEFERAEEVLNEIIDETHRLNTMRSGITDCCNAVLTGHCLRPNIGGAMRIYRLMEANEIRTNAKTYSALMQALVKCRRTDAAKMILEDLMPRRRLKATSLHYAILINGYVHQRSWVNAVVIYRRMQKVGIQPSVPVLRMYLRAKFFYERSKQAGLRFPMRKEFKKVEPGKLDMLKDIAEAVKSYDPAAMAVKIPRFGADKTSFADAIQMYLDYAMYYFGTRGNLKQVEFLYNMYKKHARKQGIPPGPPPMRIITALMNAYMHAKQYDKVEEYWQMAKTKAEALAPAPKYVPQLSSDNRSMAEGGHEIRPADGSESNSAENDRAETGFRADGPVEAQTTSPTGQQAPVPPSASLAPAFSTVLTRPLRFYLRTLLLQGRIEEMIKVATQLLKQGYRFDPITWNRLVEYLCLAPRPPVLLAYTLTERYLMPGFPGWRVANTTALPKRSERASEFEFMHMRYENVRTLRPQYRTLLYLAKALVDLRKEESVMGEENAAKTKGLEALRGTFRQVREKAPRTIAALRTMPRQREKWQMKILGRMDG